VTGSLPAAGSRSVFSALAAGRALAAVTSLMNIGDSYGVDSLLCCCLDVSVTATVATRVRVRVTLQLTVGQSVRLGVEHRLGLMTRYLFLYESCSYLQSDAYEIKYVQYVKGLCHSRLGTVDYALFRVAIATTAV
jgi:hypothetical protein